MSDHLCYLISFRHTKGAHFIRTEQYFPKNTDFKNLSPRKLAAAIKQLNTRPRKRLDFQTAYDMMNLELLESAS